MFWFKILVNNYLGARFFKYELRSFLVIELDSIFWALIFR